MQNNGMISISNHGVRTLANYAAAFAGFEIINFLICAALCGLIRYVLVPNVSLEQKLDLVYDTSCKMAKNLGNNRCTYPSMEFPLSFNNSSMLSFGQPYTITAQFTLPDSPKNAMLGMNIVSLSLLDDDHKLIEEFRKPFSVPYHSDLVRIVNRLLLMPFYAFQFLEEHGLAIVQLASGYKNQDVRPVMFGRIVLESHELVWTDASVKFFVRLSAFRSWLYFWPISSFLIVTLSLFTFVHLLCFLSIICALVGGFQVNGVKLFVEGTRSSPHPVSASSHKGAASTSSASEKLSHVD